MLDILFWISIFSGGLVVLLLLLSLIGGLDFDLDLDADADVDGSGGGLGFVKGSLTFLATASWVFRLMLISEISTPVSLSVAILVGITIVYLMSKILGFLIKQTEDNSFSAEDAVDKKGKVYLKVPSGGQGIVKVNVNGAMREFKAKTYENEDIPTGSEVHVLSQENEVLIVGMRPIES